MMIGRVTNFFIKAIKYCVTVPFGITVHALKVIIQVPNAIRQMCSSPQVLMNILPPLLAFSSTVNAQANNMAAANNSSACPPNNSTALALPPSPCLFNTSFMDSSYTYITDPRMRSAFGDDQSLYSSNALTNYVDTIPGSPDNTQPACTIFTSNSELNTINSAYRSLRNTNPRQVVQQNSSPLLRFSVREYTRRILQVGSANNNHTQIEEVDCNVYYAPANLPVSNQYIGGQSIRTTLLLLSGQAKSIVSSITDFATNVTSVFSVLRNASFFQTINTAQTGYTLEFTKDGTNVCGRTYIH